MLDPPPKEYLPLKEYPPLITLEIKPAPSVAGHERSSHLVVDVLGLSRTYQFSLSVQGQCCV